MTQEQILEYNKMCADFLGLKKKVHNEKEKEWYLTCYPTLPEHREAYNLPLNFPSKYEHPNVIFALYDNLPVQNERVCVAKLKFHSDWNWIMEVVEAIEKSGFNTDSYSPIQGLVEDNFYEFNIWNKINPEIQGRGNTNKEAVVQAINKFLTWYNKNK
jgi:hypothetical protein